MKAITLYFLLLLALPAMLTAQYTGGIGGGGTSATLNNAPLPVQLASFTSIVSGRNIKLFWVTSSEQNNSGFEIQRAEVKNQGLEFYKVGYMNGSGTKTTPTTYTYNDNKLNSGKYQYRLKQIDNNGNFEYFNLSSVIEVALPMKYNLSQNYPNPFNPVTKIDFEIPENTFVKIFLYDMLGREVKAIMKENKTAGYYTVTLDVRDLTSGAYFYRMEAGKYIKTLKMSLVK